MHILLMLILMILGLAAGQYAGWLAGVLLICGGLYVGGVGGSAEWRHRQESLWTVLGLASLALVLLGAVFNW